MDKKADCKYLVGSRSCGVASQSFEGMRRRNRFCRSFLKNHCCYVCSVQESCSIRCMYLDESGKQDFSKEASDKIIREVEKYQNEIGRLTVLHANGEIGELSFLAAMKTLDNKIAGLKGAGVTDLPLNVVPEPARANPDVKQKPYEFRGSYEPERTLPTHWWYLVPVLFGLLGGIIMYVALRNEDEGMASEGLVVGLGITAVGVLLFWYSGWLF